MSKKDFVTLALHLAYVRPPTIEGLPDQRRSTWRASVDAVAEACALQGPNFNRERFIDACTGWTVVIRDGRLERW